MTPYRRTASKVDVIAGIAFLVGALLCAAAVLSSFTYPFMLIVALALFAGLFGLRFAITWWLRALALRSLTHNRCPWCGDEGLESSEEGRFTCSNCGSRFTGRGDRLFERDA